MTNRTRSQIHASIAAMILTAVLAAPAAAQKHVRLKGTFHGQDVHDTTLPPGTTTLVIRTVATGTGTHLGRFSLLREVAADLVTFAATGAAHWRAANGDSIYTTVVGQAELDIPGGFLKVEESHTVTGGTGRFTGVQGSFEVVLFHTLEPSGVAGGAQSHDIFGSFDGTITGHRKK